jgi:hypothetical protein
MLLQKLIAERPEDLAVRRLAERLPPMRKSDQSPTWRTAWQPALAPFNDVIAAHNGHCLRLSSRAATPPGDEIVEAPVIARRRSDRADLAPKI